MQPRFYVAGLFASVLLFAVVPAMGIENEEAFKLTCADGFQLDGAIRFPARVGPDSARKVIILNHGSGAHSMDQDLTAVTRGGQRNLFLRDVAQTLSAVGFVVVRYHKRAYQVGLKLQADPAFQNSDHYQQFAANPLKAYVDDCVSCIRYVEHRFSEADVYLLGHSLGTYVALQAAHQANTVKGVALIGFYATSSDFLLLEQSVYRPLRDFAKLDTNHDGLLSQQELAIPSSFAASLVSQRHVLDTDIDQNISRIEYDAANLASVLVGDLLPKIDLFRAQETRYPRVNNILKNASFKVAFFQGLLDNQTLAYNAKAIELANRNVWKKTNFRFFYFASLGHALDQRSSFGDLTYGLIDPEAKQKMATELAEFF